MKLAELLLDPGRRASVVKDCVRLIDDEVAAKGGVTGLAIKTGYKVVKTLKPGMIGEAMNDLLDEFVGKLEPFFDASQDEGAASFGDYTATNGNEIAESLLSITDRRAERASKGTILKTYKKLRPFAKKNVLQAVPGIGRLIDRYAREHAG